MLEENANRNLRGRVPHPSGIRRNEGASDRESWSPSRDDPPKRSWSDPTLTGRVRRQERQRQFSSKRPRVPTMPRGAR